MRKLTDADFEGERLASGETLAVAFMADWCGFCRMFKKDWEARAAELGIEAAIGDVTDYDSKLWDTFSVRVVPTLVLFREGKPVWRRDGKLMAGLSGRDINALKEAAAAAAP